MKQNVEDFIEKIEKDVISLSDFEVLLTAEEQSVLNVLKGKKRAMTVNEIRDALIDDFVQILQYYSQLRKFQKKEEIEKLVKEKPRPSFWAGEYVDHGGLFLRLLEKLSAEGVNTYRVLSEQKRKIARLLKEVGIVNIPAYRTIERILREFEASGVVISRTDSRGKGKKLYAINPRVLRD